MDEWWPECLAKQMQRILLIERAKDLDIRNDAMIPGTVTLLRKEAAAAGSLFFFCECRKVPLEIHKNAKGVQKKTDEMLNLMHFQRKANLSHDQEKEAQPKRAKSDRKPITIGTITFGP